MLEKVLACPNLPTLPTVAVDLLKLTGDPEVDLADISQLVEKDVALSGKILRTVNSSYYGLSQPCPTINRALAYLGLNTVKSLVLGFSLVDLSQQCKDGFDLIHYWRRGLFSAAAARRIAQVTDSCDPDETFLAALMQDIGMLAMHTALGKQYQQVVVQPDRIHEILGKTPALAETRPGLGVREAEADGLVAWQLGVVTGGDLPEDFIAGLMTERVVDHLELVGIGDDQPQTSLPGLGLIESRLHFQIEFLSVPDAGEVVGQCLPGERLP